MTATARVQKIAEQVIVLPWKEKEEFLLWRANPRHSSLRFKKIGGLWSIRIGSGYRALALLQDDTFFWFWIGAHDEYKQFLS